MYRINYIRIYHNKYLTFSYYIYDYNNNKLISPKIKISVSPPPHTTHILYITVINLVELHLTRLITIIKRLKNHNISFSNLQSKLWQIVRAAYTCLSCVRDLVRTDITCLAMIIYRMTVGFAFIINPLVIRLFAKHRLSIVLIAPLSDNLS